MEEKSVKKLGENQVHIEESQMTNDFREMLQKLSPENRKKVFVKMMDLLSEQSSDY